MKRFLAACFVVVGLVFVVPVQQAQALYDNTSAVFGQFDVFNDPTTPIYTTSYPDGIPATNAYNFDSNLGSVIFDETRHRLFVADTNNNRVLVYETDVNNTIPFGEAPDYVLGQASFLTNTAAQGQSGFTAPQALALDEANGRLFVSEGTSNCRVMVFNVSGAITNGMNASNVLGGSVDFDVSSCTSTTYSTTNLNAFNNPGGVAYDPDTNFLYVSDSGKRRITIFDVAVITNGESATSVVLGDSTGNFSLLTPKGIDLDTTNNRLFVSDGLKNRVLVYDITGLVSLEDPVNVLGQPDFATVTAGTTQAKMFFPQDVAYKLSTNQLAVGLTGGRVLIYDVASISNGENASFVLGQANFTTVDDTTITLAFTNNVNSVEWVASSQLLALDINRMLSFDITSISNGEAATNVLGQVSPGGGISTTTRTSDGFAHSAYGLDDPVDVDLDTTNNRMYISDNDNNRILVYELDATTKLPLDTQADYVLGATVFTSPGDIGTTNDSTFKPYGVEVDETNDRLFVADQNSNRILVFDVSTITNGESATFVLGQANFTTNNTGTTASTFEDQSIFHLAYDSTNQWLFAGDAYNFRVMLFDLSGGITNGMAASRVIGQANLTSNVCGLSINAVCDIEGQLFFDTANRRLFVADTYGRRILVFTIPSTLAGMSNGMDASYVIGQADFDSDNATPVSTRVNLMYGFALTSKGMLLVNDCYRFRILAYDISTLANDPLPIGVIGQADFTSTSVQAVGPNTMECTSVGQGMVYDDLNNRLYMADGDFNRVLAYDFAQIDTTTLPDGTEGSSYSESLSSSQLNSTGTFSLQSGTLPTGLSVGASSVTGTPTTAGTFPFSLRLTDDGGSIGSFFTSQSYSVTIAPLPPSPSPSPSPSPTPTSEPSASPSPSPTPSPSPSPSPVTAGAPNLGGPSGTTTSNPPAFSWTAPAEPEKVESYSLLIDGQVLFSSIPTTSSLETADYILVYESSTNSYLLQLKNPLEDGSHTWQIQSISTSGNVTESGTNTFYIGTAPPVASPSPEPNEVATSSAIPLVTGPVLPSPSPSGEPESVDLREQAVQIIGAFTSLNDTVAQVLENLKPSAPLVPLAVTVAAGTAAAGFVALQVGTQLFNPKIFLEILRSLGLLAQKTPQGMVFDAATFTPIPFALITLSNKDATVNETVVTDMYGVYRGVKLPVGEYQLIAAHQEYTFPSAKPRPSYFGSKDFYQGEAFNVSSAKYQQLFLIPMDDLLQRVRKRSLKVTLAHTFGWVLHHQTQVTAAFFGLSVVMTYLAPNPINFVLTTFYGLLLMKKLAVALKAPLVSGVIGGPQGKPLAGAIVRFADVSSNELKALAQTNDKGAFKAFIDKGTYQVSATKLGYLWQEAGMSLNQMTFDKPTQMKVKMQKAEAMDMFL